MSADHESLGVARDLREYAGALDKDRGHDKSAVTRLMRDAADEIERLRGVLTWISDASYVGNYSDEKVVEIHRKWAKNALAEAARCG